MLLVVVLVAVVVLFVLVTMTTTPPLMLAAQVVQVGQKCAQEHEKGTLAAMMSFLHAAMVHHAAMLQLTTEAYQELSKLQ